MALPVQNCSSRFHRQCRRARTVLRLGGLRGCRAASSTGPAPDTRARSHRPGECRLAEGACSSTGTASIRPAVNVSAPFRPGVPDHPASAQKQLDWTIAHRSQWAPQSLASALLGNRMEAACSTRAESLYPSARQATRQGRPAPVSESPGNSGQGVGWPPRSVQSQVCWMSRASEWSGRPTGPVAHSR